MFGAAYNQLIIQIKKRSFFLFLLPALALGGSLILHNFITSFNFKPNLYSYYKQENIDFICDKNNNFCLKNNFFVPVKQNIIGNCGKFNTKFNIVFKNQIIQNPAEYEKLVNTLINENQNEKFNLKFKNDRELNNNCIKNSSLYSLYKLIPYPFQKIYELKNDKNFQPATSGSVFPFIYGETSISNIVKRYPVNFIFKPLIYISCIIMILYWFSYNKIINHTYDSKKINNFFIFGTLSSLFLFLHVTFLGHEFDNKILKLIKRLMLIFFIFFYVIAQYYLVKDLYKLKNKIKNFINLIFLRLKIILVISVILATIIILAILTINNLSSKLDYILEWNYFSILLIYYLFSFLMWKKVNS